MSHLFAANFPVNDIDVSAPMTFQIGLLASDGWVMASDRRSTEMRFPTSIRDRTLGYATSEANKFLHLPDSGATLCCAGSQASRDVMEFLGDEIVKGTFNPQLKSTEFRRAIETVHATSAMPYGSERILAVFYACADRPELWSIDISTKTSFAHTT